MLTLSRLFVSPSLPPPPPSEGPQALCRGQSWQRVTQGERAALKETVALALGEEEVKGLCGVAGSPAAHSVGVSLPMGLPEVVFAAM